MGFIGAALFHRLEGGTPVKVRQQEFPAQLVLIPDKTEAEQEAEALDDTEDDE